MLLPTFLDTQIYFPYSETSNKRVLINAERLKAPVFG